MVTTGSPTTTARELRDVALRYIRHKQILARACNYRNNLAYQTNVGRLKGLYTWLINDGKFSSVEQLRRVISTYANALRNTLPHQHNPSYQSSSEQLAQLLPQQ